MARKMRDIMSPAPVSMAPTEQPAVAGPAAVRQRPACLPRCRPGPGVAKPARGQRSHRRGARVTPYPAEQYPTQSRAAEQFLT